MSQLSVSTSYDHIPPLPPVKRIKAGDRSFLTYERNISYMVCEICDSARFTNTIFIIFINYVSIDYFLNLSIEYTIQYDTTILSNITTELCVSPSHTLYDQTVPTTILISTTMI